MRRGASAGRVSVPLPPVIAQWFADRGWQVRSHQLGALAAARAGRHALVAADTGAGKTLAGFLPTLADVCNGDLPDGLHTIYVSPLKALAQDVQRNLLIPVEEMGLPIRVETRTGDTSSERKARQRAQPPHVLLTTPESLSLLLSYPEAPDMFATLRRVVVDEIHALAPGKRGDLLALALARVHALAPEALRTGLSATVADPDAYRGWLAPGGDVASVDLVAGEAGAPAQVHILLPQGARVPWGGHAASWAIPQLIDLIRAHRLTLIFTNTRFLAEYTFKLLWDANPENLPIGIHHGSLSREARVKVEAAMAEGRLRALVCTASLDLGVDWGDVDLVVQMGAPKGSSRLLQRIGRANHRLDRASKAILVPGNRFEYLEAVAAIEAVRDGQRDGEALRPGSLDVLAQHVMGVACAGPFHEDALLAEIRAAAPYAAVSDAQWARVLGFASNGGYALRAYDRFRRIRRARDGTWTLTHPQIAARHRLNAGIIVDADMVEVAFRNGRALGRVEEEFAAGLAPGDTFRFAGLDLEVESLREGALLVRASKRAAAIPSYMGARIPISTHLAGRVRALLGDSRRWAGFPDDVREWLEMQRALSEMPGGTDLLVESFPLNGQAYSVFYTFEGWPANQSLGMLISRRMEAAGLAPLGFVANDYALALWGLHPIGDPAALLSPDILVDEFVAWVEGSYLLRRAFREVAVISGLIERQQPGARKSARQVTFSTDLIYDVLRRYEPDHLLIEAAWADARARMTDVARVADVLERAGQQVRHRVLPRISPMAVPVLAMIGRESLPAGAADDALLIEAEALAAEAMRG
ncbi:ligase-associated DNA damage response DEXH box helicase [Novosphingobium sp. FSY-8]|uniref:Ligase-associated DNA damage response DEXH box helicase n=1 Tax=Novosphingobium ovatum TaxID=1908523 RepID=A0ABW9XGR3_9SPHN|nr:ligase-associated DNA damage response DEXH box helicase [Novosphingobium ovatum]NBC37728.1 ligase-associated DNA damage response DEXH box helicase [Novosphingobium ovatum]